MSWFWARIGDYEVRTRNPPPDPEGRGISLNDALDLDSAKRTRLNAIHEAAHGAVARSFGMDVIRMQVGDDVPSVTALGASGMISVGVPRDTSWLDMARYSAAGERGAARWLCEQDLDTPRRLWANELTATSDRVCAEEYAAEVGMRGAITYGEPDSPRTRDWGDLCQDADEILDRQWPGVLRAGDALAQRGYLNGDEFGHLLGGA